MKAIIMAGGEGSRLRPLTCDCPKPMVPLMDRPVMAYTLNLLKRHGIREAAVTLHYLPDRIQDYFGDGSDFGVALRYYVEKTPLGTAGSVRQAKDFLTEPFVVLSGDGLTDCDLSEAIRFHRDRGALATLVTKRVESPMEYGVVIADADGRIRRFVEKPGWGEVFSDAVNTGIYIFEPDVLCRIPDDRPFDFGHDLFPALLKEEVPFYAYAMSGYWCDVGDLSAYLRAHADAMDGRIGLPMPGPASAVCRMPGARVDRSAVLEGPCFIGKNAVVQAGARIGAYSVLGEGSIVGPNASVKRAVLWPNARIHPLSQARGCILCENASLGEGANAFEESVLGAGAHLGARGTLLPGVKVWPGKTVPDGARLDANWVWGGGERPAFVRGRLALKNPAHAARAAQAFASALRPKNVVLARSASSVALSHALAVESGLMAQGVQVLNAGVGSLPQLRVAVHLLRADSALFVDGETLRPLTGEGLELSAPARRRVEGLLLRQDYERAFSAVTKLPVPAGRIDLMYAGHLLSRADTDALTAARPRIAVFAPNEQLLSAAESILEKTGCSVRAEWEDEMMDLSPGETGVWLTEDGESMRFSGEDGALTDSEDTLLRTWALLETGSRRIILPMSATRAAEALAGRYGAKIVRVRSERAAFMKALTDEDRHQFMMRFDGLYAALTCLGCLARASLSLSRWLRDMPRLSRSVRTVAVGKGEKGRVLSLLMAGESAPDMTDGLSVSLADGWAWISPSEEREECRIVAEAMEEETAGELCDLYAERVLHALAADKKPR